LRETFTATLRSLAQFAREPVSKDLRVAATRCNFLRETITTSFDSVRAFADAVALEFGPSRNQDLAFRSRIRKWQLELRALFLMRIALWKYRVQLPGFELPEPVRVAQQECDYQSAKVLDDIAERLRIKYPQKTTSSKIPSISYNKRSALAVYKRHKSRSQLLYPKTWSF
jgi:multidrug resistance protein MdtO